MIATKSVKIIAKLKEGKMRNRTKLMALCAAASTLALPLASQAQQTPPNDDAPAAQTEAPKTRTFALRHIAKAQMLQWLEAGTIPLPNDVSELHAVEAGNALTASGSSDSLNQLGSVIGQLDQPLQLIQCSVQAFLLQPGEADRIRKLDVLEDGVLPTPQNLALLEQRQMNALLTSPGVYVMSGAGTWINGVPAILPLRKTPKSPAIGMMIGLQTEKDNVLTLSMSDLFSDFESNHGFSSKISGGVSTTPQKFGTLSTGLRGELAKMMERAGAPRNADIMIFPTVRLLKTAPTEAE